MDRRKSIRRGFAAIVLGVVGLVIGGIWVSSAAMYENYKVNKTVEEVFTIARNVQNLISIRDSEVMGNGVLITSTIIAANAVSSNLVNGNGIKNLFDGNVTIKNMHDAYPARVRIALYDIPTSACVRIVVKISAIGAFANGYQGGGTIDRIGLAFISINTTVNYSTSYFPVPLDAAKTACNQEKNDLFFDFGYTRVN